MIIKQKIKDIFLTNNRIIVLICHFLYLIFFFLIFLPQYGGFGSVRFPDILVRDVGELGVISIFMYIFYYFLKRYKIRLNIRLYSILVVIFISYLLTLSFMFYEKWGYEYDTYKVFERFSLYIGITVLVGGSMLLVENLPGIISLFDQSKLKAELNNARNRILKHQFNPHFLFNALNSLYSLSLSDKDKTSDAILKLSSLMRYLTDEMDNKVVSLKREIQFIKGYIEIEKLRFGEESNIKFEICGSYDNILIEPFLLITLVENAFKHGFYTKYKDAFIDIKLTVEKELLHFVIKNSVQHSKTSINREGKGLIILKDRLELSYPKRSELILENKGDIFVAELKLNLNS